MDLKIALTMDYAIQPGDAALLAITVAETPDQSLTESQLEVENADLRWLPGADGVGARVWALPYGDRLRLQYRAGVRVTRARRGLHGLRPARWQDLGPEVLPYLRPSRFCPSDQFVGVVAREFGHLEGGALVAALRDWTEAALAYVPGSSGPGTTALDTFLSRQGVCRDYAHVFCALVRAAGIPARYTTGYGPEVAPQDFHALAEVWLEGGWQMVDPTGMSSAHDLAVISVGRDAGDVAFMETGGFATCLFQSVEVWPSG